MFNFVVDVDEDVSNEQLDKAITELKQSKYCNEVKLLGGKSIPWFPRKLSDIDYFSSETLEAGAELESDHVSFVNIFIVSKGFYFSLDLPIPNIVTEENTLQKLPRLIKSMNQSQKLPTQNQKLIPGVLFIMN